MGKTQKELAFLRDLYVVSDWTKRFTDLVDRHFSFANEENLLYINPGTGNHAFALRERLDDKIAIFATSEDEDILHIARDKAAAIKSNVDFSMIRFEDDWFDAVIADATLVRPLDFEGLLGESVRVAKTGADIGILLVTAGSFGEIFSMLWEVLFNEDLGKQGAVAEALIRELPTIGHVEQIAKAAGLGNIKIHTAKEIFEYDDGAAFISSPLVADFLLPAWLRSLNENEQELVANKMAELIDVEDGYLSFRFCVKAALLVGEKQRD